MRAQMQNDQHRESVLHLTCVLQAAKARKLSSQIDVRMSVRVFVCVCDTYE